MGAAYQDVSDIGLGVPTSPPPQLSSASTDPNFYSDSFGWMLYGSLAGVVYNGEFTVQISAPCPSPFTPSSSGLETFTTGPDPFTGYVEGDALGAGPEVLAFSFSGMADATFVLGGNGDSVDYGQSFSIVSGTATEVYPNPPSPTPEPRTVFLVLIGLPLLLLLKLHHKLVPAARSIQRT
ncbi:MAG: hypothetical protein ACRD22_19605 [Terriglobia bacterium]